MPLAKFWFENMWVGQPMTRARHFAIIIERNRILKSREVSQKLKPKPAPPTQEIQDWHNLRQIVRRKNNPHLRIKSNLSTRLSRLLRFADRRKDGITLSIVGCSRDELIRHLERQFKPGMAWNNYGEWEIDHIKPCYQFDFTKEGDARRCFHFLNLRPLWGTENRSRLRPGIRSYQK